MFNKHKIGYGARSWGDKSVEGSAQIEGGPK